MLGGLFGQYDKVCAVMADMQREIFARYHERYPEAFYGWYFTPEISNVPTMKASVPSLARGLNRVLDTATALDPAMPVLLSPYFTEYLAVPSVLATLPLWQTLLETAHFRDGDIFCPQDAVGAQWTPQRDLEKVWQMYREAVDGCGKELCLWANCETLTVARKAIPLMPPATVETVNSAATLDRLVWQMQIAAKYCDEIVTFSYNHYYCPLTGTRVYHDCYLDYLKNALFLLSVYSSDASYEKQEEKYETDYIGFYIERRKTRVHKMILTYYEKYIIRLNSKTMVLSINGKKGDIYEQKSKIYKHFSYTGSICSFRLFR